MIGEIEVHSVINELAETPLMLTAICIQYYDGRSLPDQRAARYCTKFQPKKNGKKTESMQSWKWEYFRGLL